MKFLPRFLLQRNWTLADKFKVKRFQGKTFLVAALMALIGVGYTSCDDLVSQLGMKTTLQGGTGVGNIQVKNLSLSFASYEAKSNAIQMCLTHFQLRFSSSFDPQLTNSLAAQVGGFSESYVFFNASDSHYYVKGLLTKPIHLQSVGTEIGTFALPATSVDEVIFGFSQCGSQSSLSFTNSQGTFSDLPGNYMGITYTSSRDLNIASNLKFDISNFITSLDSVQSQSQLSQTLKPYRNFDLVAMISNQFPGLDSVTMKALGHQKNGKTIAAGSSLSSWGAVNLIFARYNLDGSLDTSFGDPNFSPGMQAVSMDENFQYGMNMAIAPDDSVILVTDSSVNNRSWFTIVKLNPQGIVDKSFGTNGWVQLDGGGNSYAQAVQVDGNGSIYFCGVSDQHLLEIVNLKPTGVIDSSFGTQGWLQIPFTGYDYSDPMSLVLQTDGSLLAGFTAASANGDRWTMSVAKILKQGQLDLSFGNQGIASIDYGFDTAAHLENICLQPDQKIVVVGQYSDTFKLPESPTAHFAISRLNSTGTLDNQFASGGKTSMDFGIKNDAVSCLTMPSGNILVGGNSVDNGVYSYVMAFVTPQGNLDTSMELGTGYKQFALGNGAIGQALLALPNGSYYFGGASDQAFTLLTIAPQ